MESKPINNKQLQQFGDGHIDFGTESPKDQDLGKASVQELIGQPKKQVEDDKNFNNTLDEPEDQEQPKKKASAVPAIIFIVILIIIVAGGILVLRKLKANKAEQEALIQASIDASIEAEEESRLLAELDKQQETQPTKVEEPEITDTYSDEDVKLLRELGFTQKEIQSYYDKGYSAEEIKTQLEAEIKNRYKGLQMEAIETPENLYKWTQFGQWDVRDNLQLDQSSSQKSYSQNVRFEKIPAYGLQLKLKLYLNPDNDKEWIDVTVDPAMYNALKNTGSVTIKYNYRVSMSGGYFVYNIEITDEFLEEARDLYLIDNNID